MTDPYKLLGVSREDSLETIKKAYRKAAKECHPDTHQGDRRAEKRFKELGEAYRILSDEQKRKEYDGLTGRQTASFGKRDKTDGSAGTIFPEEIHSRFEQFFSMGNRSSGKEKQGMGEKNPIDVSDLFESHMGMKR